MTAPDGGGVVITLGDIYRQVVGLAARVDAALSKVDNGSEQIADHETRLRALERGRWPIASATVLAALGSVAVSILVALYGGK